MQSPTATSENEPPMSVVFRDLFKWAEACRARKKLAEGGPPDGHVRRARSIAALHSSGTPLARRPRAEFAFHGFAFLGCALLRLHAADTVCVLFPSRAHVAARPRFLAPPACAAALTFRDRAS